MEEFRLFESHEKVTSLHRLRRTFVELIQDEPLYFAELCERFVSYGFQAVTQAIGLLHENAILWQDPEGRFCLKGSEFAAVPPER